MLKFGIAAIHVEKIGRKQRGFLAAGTGAHFEHGVLLIQRIGRKQHEAQLVLALGQFLFDATNLFLSHFADVVILVAQKFLVFLKLLLEIAVFTVGKHHGLHVGAGLGDLAVLFRVGQNRGIRHVLFQLLVAFFQTFQFSKHSHSITIGSGDSKRPA